LETAVTTASPTMTPRQMNMFSDWYVVVVWPDGHKQQVNGFKDERHARGWIEHESQAWLAKAARPGGNSLLG
jgi:hypothetical protein